jgi:hypothetical protein
MKCPKLKQWYPVTCLKVHLSEGSLFQHGGSTTTGEGGDEQWHQSVVKVVPSHTLPSCQSSTSLFPLMASIIASMKVLELQMFVGEF